MEHINLLLCINDKFVNLTLVLLKSVLANTNKSIKLFLVGNLSEASLTKITDLSTQISITRINGVEEKCDQLYKWGTRWPSIILARMLVPFLVEDSIDKLLYLDVDMIANCDISEIFDINLNKKCLGVTSDKYFNSGFILFNVSEIKKQHTLEEMSQFISSFDKPLSFPDQDLLNEFYKNEKINIGSNYNYRAWNTFMWKNPIKNGAKIIHYAGKIKPDNYKYIEWKANKPFWKYARKIYGRKTEFTVKIKSFFWYPIALLRRFIYHTGKN